MCIRVCFARKIPLLAKHGKRADFGPETTTWDERKDLGLAKISVKILTDFRAERGWIACVIAWREVPPQSAFLRVRIATGRRRPSR